MEKEIGHFLTMLEDRENNALNFITKHEKKTWICSHTTEDPSWPV